MFLLPLPSPLDDIPSSSSSSQKSTTTASNSASTFSATSAATSCPSAAGITINSRQNNRANRRGEGGGNNDDDDDGADGECNGRQNDGHRRQTAPPEPPHPHSLYAAGAIPCRTTASTPSPPPPSLALMPSLMLCLLIVFLSSTSFACASGQMQQQQQPRPSCREHLLNGNADDGVFPILSPSGIIFWLECRFPPPGVQSARLSVQTAVNNALVGQWLTGEQIAAAGQDEEEGIHVQQQVNDRDFLRQLMADSDECSQRIRIRWPNIRGGNESMAEGQSVIAATTNGQKLEFRRNSSRPDFHEELLTIQLGPIEQIRAPLQPGISVTAEPLLCRQMLIPRAECQFELRADSDRVRLKISALRRLASSAGASSFSFAFRIGKPSGRLLELLDGGNGPLGALDLVDGYLLFANHITHPVKLLADGLWHSLHLDLHSLSLRVDDQSTALSLRASADEDEPQWLDILLHGEVAALRLLTASNGAAGEDRPDEWLCGDKLDLLDVRQSVPQQHIFALPSVCTPSASGKNFCNCRGPNSALAQNGGVGRHAQVAQCALIPDLENALHFSRLVDRLAFLLVPNFGPKTPVSVQFKSEKDTGLVFFGTYSTPFSPVQPKAMLAANGGRELGGRVQVHFAGTRLFGAICSQLADGSEKCFSCSIPMQKAFSSSDRWARVSLFYQLNYQFLSVDNQVCLLSPNAHAVDAAELYRISATNVLLVGGAFYAKHALLSQRVADQFRRDFQDNTREKAPSLKGCIAELVIRGQAQNLSHLLGAQMARARREDHAETTAIFSVQTGCPECPSKCNGAPCSHEWGQSASVQASSAICQCSAIYASTDSHGGCQQAELLGMAGGGGQFSGAEGMAMGSGGLQLHLAQQKMEEAHSSSSSPSATPSIPIRGPPNARTRTRSRLDRIWMLWRLPEQNAQMHPFIGIGSLHISVGDHGHRVVVESKEYGLNEEFLLPQPLDQRLHLFAVERHSSIGTAPNGQMLTIRLDADRRRIPNLEEMPISGLDGQPAQIQIHPLALEADNWEGGEGDEEAATEIQRAMATGAGGCVQELLFHYDLPVEELSTMSLGIEPRSSSQGQEINYVGQFREQFPSLFFNNNNNAALGPWMTSSNCGVRDPALWTGNYTSWGRLGQHGDDGAGGAGPIGYILRRGSSLPRISLLITTALILLVLISLSVYMFYAIKRHYSDEDPSHAKLSGGKNQHHFKELRASEHERRPLKLQMEEEHTDAERNAPQQQPNGYAAKNAPVPPPRPPKSGGVQFAMGNGATTTTTTADEKQKSSNSVWYFDSSSDRTRTTMMEQEPLRIQPLDSSSKHLSSSTSPGAGSLRVTPLRSQPLRTGGNGGNGRFQVQSPLAAQRAQFFNGAGGTNSAHSPPSSSSETTTTTHGMLNLSPEPNNNNINKAHQHWSGSGSAGFFTPSPTSGTSSTSPGSNSSQGNELMRPPIVRVVATAGSRQHSPAGNAAAPIVCKEEL